MISWTEFKSRQPELARDGADLLYHFGVGLAFLGTVRPDGGPRLHPICPLVTDTGLYAFIVERTTGHSDPAPTHTVWHAT